MQYEQHVEEGIGVVGEPKRAKEVSAAPVGKDIDDSCLEGEQDPSDASDCLPTPIVELGQHMCTTED